MTAVEGRVILSRFVISNHDIHEKNGWARQQNTVISTVRHFDSCFYCVDSHGSQRGTRKQCRSADACCFYSSHQRFCVQSAAVRTEIFVLWELRRRTTCEVLWSYPSGTSSPNLTAQEWPSVANRAFTSGMIPLWTLWSRLSLSSNTTIADN